MIDFLVKIQKERWINDMYNHEYLRFSFHEFFRKSLKERENKGLRFDPREGNLRHIQISSIDLETPNGEKVKLERKTAKSHAEFTEKLMEPLINNCSLTKISFNDNLRISSPSKRLIKLGDKAILIWDIERFLSTVDSSIESMGLEYSRGTVVYYDYKTFNGDLSYLHKEKKYKWQNEYRILIGPNPEKTHLYVPVPNFKSMAIVVPVNDLFQYSTYINYFFLSNSNHDDKLQNEA